MTFCVKVDSFLLQQQIIFFDPASISGLYEKVYISFNLVQYYYYSLLILIIALYGKELLESNFVNENKINLSIRSDTQNKKILKESNLIFMLNFATFFFLGREYSWSETDLYLIDQIIFAKPLYSQLFNSVAQSAEMKDHTVTDRE